MIAKPVENCPDCEGSGVRPCWVCDDDGCEVCDGQPPPHCPHCLGTGGRRRIVVIESPFAAAGAEGRAANEALLSAALADCIRRGESPMASHGLYTRPGVLDDDDPEQRAAGINAGLALYAVADRCVVYIDRGVSEGMIQGILRARRGYLPIYVRSVAPRIPPATYTRSMEEIIGAIAMREGWRSDSVIVEVAALEAGQ